MGQRHAESSLKSLQRRRGIGAIDKQLHLRGVAGQQFASKVRRDIERGIGAAFAHFALELLQILHFTHYTKTLRVYETVDQLTALDGAIFVENEHRHVFHVVIERVAECNHLDQRREEKEKQCQRIAPDDDELLEEDCAEPAKKFVLHILYKERWSPSVCDNFAVRGHVRAFKAATCCRTPKPSFFIPLCITRLFVVRQRASRKAQQKRLRA